MNRTRHPHGGLSIYCALLFLVAQCPTVFSQSNEPSYLDLLDDYVELGHGSTSYTTRGTAAGLSSQILITNTASGGYAFFTPAWWVSNAWTAPALSLNVGSNLIVAYSRDAANNLLTDSVYVERGGLGMPALRFTGGGTSPTSQYTASGSNNLHVAGGLVVSNITAGTWVTVPPTPGETLTWTAAPIPLVNGVNVLVAHATNAVGTAATATMQVVYGGTAPVYGVRAVYWLSRNLCQIRSSKLNGTPVSNVLGDVCSYTVPNLAVDSVHGYVFWTHNDYVGRCNLDGTGRLVVYGSGDAYFGGLAVDAAAGRVFWTELNGDVLRAANLDGSSRVNLAFGVHDSYGVCLDVAQNNVYWSETGVYRLRRCSVYGGPFEELGSSYGQSLAGDFHHGYLYQVDAAGGMYRSDLHGQNRVRIGYGSSIQPFPEEGKIYYGIADGIVRADLDGSNPEIIVQDTSSDFSAIALEFGMLDRTLVGLHITGRPMHHGQVSSYGYGLHRLEYGAMINCSAPAIADTAGGVRYACQGYVGMGNCPATGSATSVSFTLTEDTKVTWIWQTQYSLTFQSSNGMIIGSTQGYHPSDTVIQLTAQPDTGYAFVGWTVNGVSASGESNTLTVTLSGATVVGATYREIPGWFAPFIGVTPAPAVGVAETVTLSGMNNLHLVGAMTVSNLQLGWSALWEPDGLAWTSPPIPLAYGDNQVRFSGTNLFGAVAVADENLKRGGDGTPWINATGTTEPIASDVASVRIFGTNNLHVSGISLTNPQAGAFVPFAAPAWQPGNWTSPPITLAVGSNSLIVTGTNNFGVTATDIIEVYRPGGLQPFMEVFDPPAWVPHVYNTIAVNGSNNAHVTGRIIFSNEASQVVTTMSAPRLSPYLWTSPDLPLEPGSNTIVLRVTNLVASSMDVTLRVERAGMGAPEVLITNTIQVVGNRAESYVLGGTNGRHVVYNMWVTNAANGVTLVFPAPLGPDYGWTAPSIALEEGTNLLRVFGVNAAGERTFASLTVTRLPRSYRYVAIGSPNPTPPYTNWLTAARSIQDAVNISDHDILLVSNGVYNTGTQVASQTLPNRVAITNKVLVQSVNGPAVTIIEGGGSQGGTAIRCVYISAGAELVGFTLRDGFTQYSSIEPVPDVSGGGVYAETGAVVRGCVISHCTAVYGGGASGGRIEDCLIFSNHAYRVLDYQRGHGGGIFNSHVLRCTVSQNQADFYGGGVDGCLVEDSLIVSNVVYFNTSGGGGGAHSQIRRSTIAYNFARGQGGGIIYSDARNCVLAFNVSSGTAGAGMQSAALHCTIVSNTGEHGEFWSTDTRNSLLVSSFTNVAFETLFANSDQGDFRLAPGSPAIDACTDVLVEDDYLAIARPLDGDNNDTAIPDLGAFEFVHPLADSDGDTLSDTNEIGMLGTNPAKADTDDDQMADNLELFAGTDPTLWSSVLDIRYFDPNYIAREGLLIFRWPTVTGRLYSTMISTNAETWFYDPTCRNLPGTGDIMTYTNRISSGTEWYRVETWRP